MTEAFTAVTPKRGQRKPRPPKPAYQLKLDPAQHDDSWAARENLHDIIQRELLGPLHGPEEILETAPDAAYLVGRIAPTKLIGNRKIEITDETGVEAGADVGDASVAGWSRGVPLASVDPSTPGSDEDQVDDDPQRRGLMIPASMGLRFQVPSDLEAFTVTASWGTYSPISATGEEPAETSRRYQRTPVEIDVPVRVGALVPGTTAEYDLRDQVKLRVDCYRDAPLDRLLVEVALCNDRETDRKIPVDAWLYQTRLDLHAGDEAVFLPVRDHLLDTREEHDDELRRLRLHYRDRLEFAIGRTCSADWTEAPGTRCATRVRTTWLPVSETPQTTVGPADRSGAVLDMKKLAIATREQLADALAPLSEQYGAWLAEQHLAGLELPEHLHTDVHELNDEARKVQRQISAGVAHLLDPEQQEARRCFRLMNHVMSEQRIQTQAADLRAADPSLSMSAAREAVLEEKGAAAHSWRAFQLAFILMQLPLLTDPTSPLRSGRDDATAQLLFFPTGGGKTEAYLGLAAYTFAIRRRQGLLDTPDGQLDGRSGVGVLMRYTLRLLTAQQFQRATALVCAAELAREQDPETWGSEPFRIGLWVGSGVTPKRWKDAHQQVESSRQRGSSTGLSVLQVERCPWCGTRIDARHVHSDEDERRIRVFCGDDLGGCPFAEGGRIADGLPVLTVDEEIYRLAPAFLIATVDKFARLAREGEAAALFGYVGARCDRHGYVHRDYQACGLDIGGRHPKKGRLPGGAMVRPSPRLRPPDLIIQDELHLITGALGTTVGLFEAAIDVMCAWTSPSGVPIRPLVVASTATARRAEVQVKALYGRDMNVFPPQVLTVGDTWFSQEQEITRDRPGRRYLGVSTTGVRLTRAEIRVSELLLAGGQLLLDRAGAAADPYLTLVAYFNATRELAGMARYLGDDVQTALRSGRPWSSLPPRYGTVGSGLHVAELTSRVSSRDITATLDQMKVTFDEAFDSSAGGAKLRADRKAGRPTPSRDESPFDAVLATSMLQVGVDVTRLGLMLIVGQPKNTAEYIQASSRVGRDAHRPGLVVTLGNWARPRDLAHFETFRHYHETFYSQVEALSVTPYSLTNLERGLDGVLVAAARVLHGHRRDGLSPERHAGRITEDSEFADALLARLTERLRLAAPPESGAADVAESKLHNRLGQWRDRKLYVAAEGKQLHYEKVNDEEKAKALMVSAEERKGGPPGRHDPPFVVANSMREVQPEINVLVSPIVDNLFVRPTPMDPRWQWPDEGGAS